MRELDEMEVSVVMGGVRDSVDPNGIAAAEPETEGESDLGSTLDPDG